MMAEELVNHLGSKLWLERAYSKKEGTSYNLHIKKCRGYIGPTPIINWMRVKKQSLSDQMAALAK